MILTQRRRHGREDDDLDMVAAVVAAAAAANGGVAAGSAGFNGSGAKRRQAHDDWIKRRVDRGSGAPPVCSVFVVSDGPWKIR